jgi:lysophospholipase L1-like esterase
MSRAIERFERSCRNADGPTGDDCPGALMSKTARTLAGFVILALLPYAIPGLGRYRILPVATVVGWIGARQSPQANPQSGQEGLDDHASREKIRGTPGELEDPTGHELDHFFGALRKTEAGDAKTRICHYGDSPITNDGITSTVRRKFQLTFGDAGHGFILISKPWAWYGHSGIKHESTEWSSDPISISNGDRMYGLGGASFESSKDATATFGTVEEGEIGKAVSSFDIYYLARPGGGDFDVSVDGVHLDRVSTTSERVQSGFHQVRVPEGPHTMTIKATGKRESRLFGVALEAGGHGVQYDSLGVNGAFIGLLARYHAEQHWIEQLRHRGPDLIIIGYGANESQFEGLPMDQYEKDTREVIRRIRTALPEVSILFVGPMDRGERGAGGKILTRPMIPKLIAYQRRIAADSGCAFFDTFTAMGGQGTVARWREAKPRLMGGDFTHPTAQGSEVVGGLIYDALIKAYEQHKQRRSP